MQLVEVQIWAKLGEGNGTPLQYCCLENPMDGGAWKAAVHGVKTCTKGPCGYYYVLYFSICLEYFIIKNR